MRDRTTKRWHGRLLNSLAAEELSEEKEGEAFRHRKSTRLRPLKTTHEMPTGQGHSWGYPGRKRFNGETFSP